MKIKAVTIANRSLDKPRAFPTAKSPALLTAPDLRIKIKPEIDETQGLEHEALLEDARKNVKFSSRGLL
jgi:hypothetical protein